MEVVRFFLGYHDTDRGCASKDLSRKNVSFVKSSSFLLELRCRLLVLGLV